jgi:hypothetical protein
MVVLMMPMRRDDSTAEMRRQTTTLLGHMRMGMTNDNTMGMNANGDEYELGQM